MKNLRIDLVIVLCLYLFLIACTNNRLNINVSNVQVAPVQLKHFDKDLFSLRADNIEQQISELQKKYPGFASLFINNILCPNGIKDSACIPEIIKFINEKDMKGAYEVCQSSFTESDFYTIEIELTDILKHYKYYFPQEKMPMIYTMMSGFNYSIATVDSSEESKELCFGIGLEMYLGNKNKFYKMLQIPDYKRSSMQKQFIPRDISKALMIRKFPNESTNGTLLSEMIYQGKLLYLINALMPSAEDTLIIGFSKKQLEWCSGHEKDMWGHLIENKFLYSNATEVITKFTGEGPFTMGFVKESPARTGVWLGWNIVRKYMEENPKTNIHQLMKEEAQILLSKSKYKP